MVTGLIAEALLYCSSLAALCNGLNIARVTNVNNRLLQNILLAAVTCLTNSQLNTAATVIPGNNDLLSQY